MEKEVKICAYITDTIDGGTECKILTTEGCNGKDTGCAFYKTKAKADMDSDRAIDRCRRKGICRKCIYREVRCKRSTEVSR